MAKAGPAIQVTRLRKSYKDRPVLVASGTGHDRCQGQLGVFHSFAGVCQHVASIAIRIGGSPP